MISELNDREILDFLMTSEFEGDYSPDELKYLLFKWRYFYRVLNGRIDREKNDWDGNLIQLSQKIEDLSKEINLLRVEMAEKENLIDSLKSRKLSLKERISGKIIHIENENR